VPAPPPPSSVPVFQFGSTTPAPSFQISLTGVRKPSASNDNPEQHAK
jgi:hypothetical protein